MALNKQAEQVARDSAAEATGENGEQATMERKFFHQITHPSANPMTTASRPSATVPPRYTKLARELPPRISCKPSQLIVLNVVYPPRNPVASVTWRVEEMRWRNAATKSRPIRNEPETLINNVPNGI